MVDLVDIKEIEATPHLELEGKIFLVHKNVYGTEIDKEELDGGYILDLLLTLLTSEFDKLMPPESLENPEPSSE